MEHATIQSNIRCEYDSVITAIANYVIDYSIEHTEAWETAKLCLMDSLGCAVLALQSKQCLRVLGPMVPGLNVSGGVKVPATCYQLDPMQAAFNFGAMIRWHDYNDTWLAAEWGHPSDNLGAIYAVAAMVAQARQTENRPALKMRDVLAAMIKAYEIQGILALNNSFNQVGLDHVVLVKVASTAVVTALWGGDKDAVKRAVSQAWLDGQSLRTYRHAPNTGSRKSWAAGDACARAVWLAWLTLRGEPGYPSVLSAKQWGFSDVLFRSKPIQLAQPFSSYVMENILFKILYPAEFHAQTAVEAALKLHPQVKSRLGEIDKIVIRTQEPAIRIISKTGPLYNYADRDHCIQYMVAIPLLYGELRAEHYQDDIAANPKIDWLREKIQIQHEPQFSCDYLDSTKRSIANAVQIFFTDNTQTEEVCVEYPIGHRRNRERARPLLLNKFKHNMLTHFSESTVSNLVNFIQAAGFYEADFLEFQQKLEKI